MLNMYIQIHLCQTEETRTLYRMTFLDFYPTETSIGILEVVSKSTGVILVWFSRETIFKKIFVCKHVGY